MLPDSTVSDTSRRLRKKRQSGGGSDDDDTAAPVKKTKKKLTASKKKVRYTKQNFIDSSVMLNFEFTQCLNWFWIKLDMLCFANALLYSQASSSTPPMFTCTYLFCPYIEFGNWEQIYENIEHVVISNQELSP